MSGWIKLDRRIRNHFLFKNDVYCKRAAWTDLLICANHAPAKIKIKSKIIELNRGDQARSEVTLAKEWGWSRGKVRRFLNGLESEQMIVQQTNNLTSIITICNYNEFQGCPKSDSTADGTALDTAHGTALGTQTRRTNNNKNDKEVIEREKPTRFIPPTQIEIFDYMITKGASQQRAQNESERFFNFYESNGWKVGRNPMKNWKAASTNWLSRNQSEKRQRPNQPTIDHSTFGWADGLDTKPGSSPNPRNHQQPIRQDSSVMLGMETSLQLDSGVRRDEAGVVKNFHQRRD